MTSLPDSKFADLDWPQFIYPLVRRAEATKRTTGVVVLSADELAEYKRRLGIKAEAPDPTMLWGTRIEVAPS